MTAVRLTLNDQPAWIEFKSRYHDENDYIVTRGNDTGRVRRFDDGRIASCSPTFTDADAATAIDAYLTAEQAEYARWREANARLFA